MEQPPLTEWARPADFSHLQLARPVVLCNGAFDLLHFGHMRVLWQAKLRSRTLVVALDSDYRVHTAKGVGRPVMTYVERATTLAYMQPDYIVEIGSEADMKELVAVLRPDFRVQGADYLDKPTRFPKVRRLFVRRGEGDMSSSDIVRRCHEVPV